MNSLLDDDKYGKRSRQKRRKATIGAAVVFGVLVLLLLLVRRWTGSSSEGPTINGNAQFKVHKNEEQHHKDRKHPIVQDLINQRLDELMMQEQFDHMPVDYDSETFGDGTMAKEATKRFKEQVERASKIHSASSQDEGADINANQRFVLPERGNIPRYHAVH